MWLFELSWVELNWLFNVTIYDISVIYVTAHRCAGGLKKKLDLRSGSQRHRHFVGFFNVPVLAPTRDQPFYTVIPTHRPHLVAFYDHARDTEVHILDLTPRALTGVIWVDWWQFVLGHLDVCSSIDLNLHMILVLNLRFEPHHPRKETRGNLYGVGGGGCIQTPDSIKSLRLGRYGLDDKTARFLFVLLVHLSSEIDFLFSNKWYL